MTLRPELQATSDCLSIERFGDVLAESEKKHVQDCSRCEAELALWQEFIDSPPADEDEHAVRSITLELERRTAAARPSIFRSRQIMSLAAAAVVAVGVVGYLFWNPEPRIGDLSGGAPVYRSATIDVVSPTGDLSNAPTELEWRHAAGAARYDIQVLEMDGTLLWRATSQTPRVALPSSLSDKIVPGKTLVWKVTALDASGRSIAVSGMERFRVRVTPRRP